LIDQPARLWIRAVLTVANLLARAETLLAPKRSGLRARVALLESLVERLRAENGLLRARLLRLAPRERPRYTAWERLRILWHRTRYGLSLREAARAFVVHAATLQKWLKAIELGRRAFADALRPRRGILDLAAHLARLLRYEQPRWGSRRIAHVLARLGLVVSRSTVQRALRRGPPRMRRSARTPRSPSG
jgi:transposase